jgi:hypothetical protein
LLNQIISPKLSHSHSLSSFSFPRHSSLNSTNVLPETNNNNNIYNHNPYNNNEKFHQYLHFDNHSIINSKQTNPTLLKLNNNVIHKLSNDIINKKHFLKKQPSHNQLIFRFKTPVQRHSNSITIKANKSISIDQTKNNEIDKSVIIKIKYKENIIKVDDITIQNNSKIWEMLLEMEIHIDNKLYLISTLNKLLFYLHTEFLGSKSNINLDLFIHPTLSKQYKQIMKLSIICVMFIAFLINDFDLESELKNAMKNIIYNLNDTLLLLLKQSVFIGNDALNIHKNYKCNLIGKEFVSVYHKLIKVHKCNINNEMMNSFNLIMEKKIDGIIMLLKQFSNNHFKGGCFQSIHLIAINLLQKVENISFENIVRLIENNVLFYLIHSNSNNNTKNTKIVYNNISMQTASSFHFHIHNNVSSNSKSLPLLPPIERRKCNYTLVLDLDETLIHFFDVSLYIYNCI